MRKWIALSQYHASPFAYECLIRTLHQRTIADPDINELMTVILDFGSVLMCIFWILFFFLDLCF